MSQVLGLPENRVRVIALDVGGGFGVKIDTYPETVLAAILSMRLGLPREVDGGAPGAPHLLLPRTRRGAIR